MRYLHRIKPLTLLMALSMGLAGCRTAPKDPTPESGAGQDTVVFSATRNGAEAFGQGLYDLAVENYLKALNRARLLDKPDEAAGAAYNLAACYAAQHEFDFANTYLIEARADFSRIENWSGVGDTWLLEAKIAQAQKDLARSGALCDKALEAFDKSRGRSPMVAHAHVLKAFLACEDGQMDQAQAELELARDGGLSARDPLFLAELLATEGHLLASSGVLDRAALKYDAATVAYRNANRGREVADVLSKAASIYRLDTRHALAGERLYRAARSYYAQGDLATALKRLELAFESAKLANDTDLNEKCAALFKSIKSQVKDSASQGAGQTEGSGT